MTDLPSLASSIPARLGVSGALDDGEFRLRLHPRPETCRLGAVRVSVLSYVADAVAGIAVDTDPEAWTFTSDLSVHMRPVLAPTWLDASTSTLRQGRRSVTCEVRMTDETGEQVAYSALAFARVPRRDGDPVKPVFDVESGAKRWESIQPISEPLRDAAGVHVVDRAAGIVEVAITDELRNPAGALQGAMVALVAEVAAEEFVSARCGEPALVTDLDLRYLAQARVGPVRTRVEALGELPDAPLLVTLFDRTDDRVLTHATVRATVAPIR